MKWFRLSIALPVLVALAASCGKEVVPTMPDPDEVMPDKFAVGQTGYCNPALHNQLRGYLENSEGIIFQLFEETLDCSQTAVFTATPSGWGPGYEVELVIPAGAVPPNYPGYPMISFSLGVPVAGPGEGLTSVPYIFHPDGMQFQIPIQARLHWPPWAGEFIPDGSALAHLRTEMHEGGVHYRIDSRVDPFAILTTADKSLPTGCAYSLQHFSRWEVLNGDKDDGVDPGLNRAGDMVTDTACWTPFDPDPSDPLPVLR